MAGKAFTNLNTISLSDTFRAWFDKTNEIVVALNPLEIYGITPGSGENAGINIAVSTTGIATVGLSMPSVMTGDTEFVGGITFTGKNVLMSGGTVDFTGSTLYGNVVRTINGSTGNVTIALVGVNDSTDGTGDILIKSGGTLVAYNLFLGNTFDGTNRNFRFGASGGMILGGGAGAGSGLQSFGKSGDRYRTGTIALAGGNIAKGITSAMIHMLNLGYTGSDNAEKGMQLFFGRVNNGNSDPFGLVFHAGGTAVAQTDADGPLLVLDSTNRKFGINGITAPVGGIHFKTTSTSVTVANDILIQDTVGNTIDIRTVIAGSTTEYNGKEGATNASGARYKGFANSNRLRTITNGPYSSTGVELRFSGNRSNFSIFGQETSGISLSPALVVDQAGSVIIGGIESSDSGTTYGSLNVVSGKLLLGGTLGVSSLPNGGIQSVVSGGGTSQHKVIFTNSPDGGGSTSKLTNVVFNGTITDDMVFDMRQQNNEDLLFYDENGEELTNYFDNTAGAGGFLEFFEVDASGNQKYAVGNFEIDITMPLYDIINDGLNYPHEKTGVNFYCPVIGAIAFLDTNSSLSNINGDTVNNPSLVASPNSGMQVTKIDDLSKNSGQLTFKLTGNCTTRVKVALIVSKTHMQQGNRAGVIYKAPGSFTAKFFNVE